MGYLGAGVTRFNTADGLTVTGDADITGAITTDGLTTTANVNFGDNDKAIFGAGSDLQIYHDVSHSYIVDNGTGNLRIKAQNFQVLGNADSEAQIEAYQNDGVYLYFDGNQKLATTSGGIDVTGTVTADGLTVGDGHQIGDETTYDNLVIKSSTDENMVLSAGGTGQFIYKTGSTTLDNGSEKMRLTNDGKLGLGTSSISGNDGTLIVEGSDGKHPIIKGNDGSGNGFTLLADNYLSTESQLNLGLSHSGSNVVLSRNCKVSDVADDTYLSSQDVYTTKPAAFTLDEDGSFRFYNTNTSATRSVDSTVTLDERMRIDSSGNVGIGTSSPQARAEISGGLDNRLRINSTDGTTSNNYGIDFSTAGTVRAGIRYNAGNNYLAFYGYDNTERMRIDSSGNVGIGTNSATAKLDMSDVSRYTFNVGNAYTLQTSVNAAVSAFVDDYKNAAQHIWQISGSERMRIDSSGNVGIGTSLPDTSPSTKLHIREDDAVDYKARAVVQATDQRLVAGSHWQSGVTAYSYLQATNDAETIPNNLLLNPDGGNVGIGTDSPAAKLEVLGSDDANNLIVGHNDTDFAVYTDSTVGEVRLKAEDGSGSNFSKFMSFYTQPSGSSAAERMRITPDGKVGIGTSSPSLPLHINGSSAGDGIVYSRSGTEYFRIDDTGTDMNIKTTGGGHTITFNTSGSERMRIDSSGRLLVNRISASNNGLIELDYEPLTARDKGIVLNNSNGTSGGQACNFLFSGTSVGNITTTPSSTAYNTSSDHRLKENVTANWDATTRLKQLNPVRFNFIADADTTVDGFLAHEVQSVVPEAITGTHNEVDDEGNPVYQGIDQSKLVPLLVKTIQELEARIAALEAN